MPNTVNNTNASAQHRLAREAALASAQEIVQYLSHEGPRALTWSETNEMRRTANELTAITDRLYKRGEHA